MIRGIDRYLDSFREELRGRDRALVQDALSDAEDHLTTGFEVERREHPERSEEEALRSVIESYGAPEEVAEHYRTVEEYTVPSLAPVRSQGSGRSGFREFVGIVADPSAWASFLYMLISLATGILYFTWTVTGVSLSVSLLILIVGVPIAWLFFLSFRGLALVEGRIVEALLGVRMPRRAVFLRKGKGWWGSLKGVFSARSTWSSMVYLVLMLPLGVLYFSVFITLIALALSLIGSPVLELVFHEPVIELPNPWWIPGWLCPVVVVAGGALFLGVLHLARRVGRLHGRFARAMLVS
jgi:hypothetical protein